MGVKGPEAFPSWFLNPLQWERSDERRLEIIDIYKHQAQV